VRMCVNSHVCHVSMRCVIVAQILVWTSYCAASNEYSNYKNTYYLTNRVQSAYDACSCDRCVCVWPHEVEGVAKRSGVERSTSSAPSCESTVPHTPPPQVPAHSYSFIPIRQVLTVWVRAVAGGWAIPSRTSHEWGGAPWTTDGGRAGAAWVKALQHLDHRVVCLCNDMDGALTMALACSDGGVADVCVLLMCVRVCVCVCELRIKNVCLRLCIQVRQRMGICMHCTYTKWACLPSI